MRTCNLNITPEGVRHCKYSSCLEYQIKNCPAPCIGKIGAEKYNEMIGEIIAILKGDIKVLQEKLLGDMKYAAAKLNFEEAQRIKKKYRRYQAYRRYCFGKPRFLAITLTKPGKLIILVARKKAHSQFLYKIIC